MLLTLYLIMIKHVRKWQNLVIRKVTCILIKIRNVLNRSLMENLVQQLKSQKKHQQLKKVRMMQHTDINRSGNLIIQVYKNAQERTRKTSRFKLKVFAKMAKHLQKLLKKKLALLILNTKVQEHVSSNICLLRNIPK